MLIMGFQINDSRTKWIELFPMQPSKPSRIHRNPQTKKFFEILRGFFEIIYNKVKGSMGEPKIEEKVHNVNQI